MKKSKRHQKQMGKSGRLMEQRKDGPRGKDRAFLSGSARGGEGANPSPNPNPNPNPPVPPPRPARHPNSVSPKSTPRRPQNYIPTGSELAKQIREIYTLIRTLHHLSNVESESPAKKPKIITRLTETLTKSIKPALLTSTTLELIRDNANRWGASTMQILRDHYETKLADVQKLIQGCSNPNWETPFEIAVKWARKNLPRVKQGVLEQARTFLASSNPNKNKNVETPVVTKPKSTQEATTNTQGEGKAKQFPREPSPPLSPHRHDPRLDKPNQGQRRQTLQINTEASQTTTTPIQEVNKNKQYPRIQQILAMDAFGKPPMPPSPPQVNLEKIKNLFPGEPQLSGRGIRNRRDDIARGAPIFDHSRNQFVIIDPSLDRNKDQYLDFDPLDRDFSYATTGKRYYPDYLLKFDY